MIKLLKVFVLCYFVEKNEESCQKKTFELYSS